VLLLFIALPAAATFQCGYMLVESHTEDWAGSTVIVETYDYMCWESVDVTAPDPGPGWPPDDGGGTDPGNCCPNPPGGGGLPDPNYWMRVSASDESPYAPRVRVETSAGITGVWLLRDGQQIGYITPPSTDFDLPSLDNMTSGASFQVQATDNAGNQVLVENFRLTRRSGTAGAQGDLLLQFMYKGMGDPDYRIAHYWHVAGLAVVYADWDIATFGARNGRVFHQQIEQSLFWDNSNIAFGQSAALYPTTFNGSYAMAAYAGQDTMLLERCSTTGLTAAGWSWISYNDRISNCTYPAQYSQDWVAAGTSAIDELNASNMFFAPPGIIIGDSAIMVWP
jgi:hypothetical protein